MGTWFVLSAAASLTDRFFGTHYSSRIQISHTDRHESDEPPTRRGTSVFLAVLTAAIPCAAWFSRAQRRRWPQAVIFLFLVNLVLLAPYWVPAWARIIGTGSREHPAVLWIQAGLWANIGLISTLATCEFIWVSMVLLDPLAGLYAGPLSTLLAPFPLLLFLECSVSRHRWWSRVLFFLAGGFAGMVYKGLYEAEVSAEQEARNRRAKRLLSTIDQQMQSCRPQLFCLYLRPFQTTAHLDAQQRGSVEALDLETVLERSLESRLPLVALGRNSENAVLGSSRVYVPDEVWWAYFTRLANLATWIFVLPSDQGSTPDEISWLLSNGHLGKCIFIMPETNTGEGWQVEVQTPSTFHVSEGASIDYRPYWESVRAGLSQKLGFDLPPYDNKGAFFRLDESGAVTAFQHLGLGRSLLKARRVRKVLASLTPGRVVQASKTVC